MISPSRVRLLRKEIRLLSFVNRFLRSCYMNAAQVAYYGCVPFGESKNGFLILDLPDFAVERNVKSEIGFVTLVTFRQRVQLCATASQKMTCFLLFDKLCDYTVQNLAVGSSNSDDGTYKKDKERSTLKLKIIKRMSASLIQFHSLDFFM